MLTRSMGWFSLVAVTIAAGCSGATSSFNDGDAGNDDAGTTIDAGKDSGHKIDAGHPTDGGSATDSGNPFDGSTSFDGGTSFDAGKKDSSSSFDSGGRTCAPADVSGFVAPAYKPARRQPAACTSTQINGYYQGCLSATATQQTCAPYGSTGTAADQACAACILTPSSAASYGPLVSKTGLVNINIAGCMELKDSVNGASCARAYRASEDCNDAACQANCPVTDDASFQLYEACVQQASANGCSAYTTAASCADGEAEAGAASVCFQGQTFQDLYNQVVPIFCGP